MNIIICLLGLAPLRTPPPGGNSPLTVILEAEGPFQDELPDTAGVGGVRQALQLLPLSGPVPGVPGATQGARLPASAGL